MTIENNRDNKTTKGGGIIIPSSRFCTLDELSRENKCANKMSRGNFLKGGLAAIIASGSAPWLAGSANANVGRGMMRNVGARQEAMFGGGRIPYNRVNYIQSIKDYIQYIDTGIQFPNGFYIEGEFEFVSTLIPNNSFTIVGSHNLSIPYGRNFLGIENGKLGIGCGDTIIYSIPVNFGIKYRIKAKNTNSGESWIDVNNQRMMTQSVSGYRSSLNLHIFSMQYWEQVVGKGSSMKIWWIKLYDSYQNLAMDLIPISKDNIGYMYDRFNPTGGPLGNGLYGNSGTGYFDFPGRVS